MIDSGQEALTKEKAKIDLWFKEMAPSNELRKWFSHDPEKWNSFKEKYKNELEGKEEIIEQIKKLEKENRIVTLLHSAKDEKYNNVVALVNILNLL